MSRQLLRHILRLEEYSIVVSQYERGCYSVGNEEQFHWAIVIITNENERKGYMYQAVNKVSRTPEGLGVVVWELSTSDEVSLEKSRRCLGAVRVGVVKQKELQDLHKAIVNHPPVDTGKPDGWNCRDWVMECIEIMKEGGWAYDGINQQGDLFPTLKQASVQTKELGRLSVLALGKV
ncbi:hypothetical protein C2E23DRAFT_724361 [Lenzites betulinus]|nr:hypothetical protein C2E23DRAFT_724361 [Lenzites betulinus]